MSANYFMIAFLIFAPWGYRYSREGHIFILVMVLSYLIGLVFFSKFDPHFVERQFLSLVVGLIPVLLLFVRIRIPLETVKSVVIIASFVYSALTIRNLYVLGLELPGASALKGAIGGQRFGFILVMGLFLSLERSTRSILYSIVTVIIASGIVLQFSRAGYLAAVIGSIGYVFCLVHHANNPFSSRPFAVHPSSLRGVVSFLISVTVLSFFYAEMDLVRNALLLRYDRSYQAFANIFEGSIQPDASSEGTRLLLWEQSTDFVLSNNPLLGSGMAGLYLVVADYIETGASAHSQYIDVFLRMGLLGLAIYLILWRKLLYGFYKSSPAMFAGLLGMFVYGFFHETTKLTQGAFVFFILLNIITDKYFNNTVVKPKAGFPLRPDLNLAPRIVDEKSMPARLPG